MFVAKITQAQRLTQWRVPSISQRTWRPGSTAIGRSPRDWNSRKHLTTSTMKSVSGSSERYWVGSAPFVRIWQLSSWATKSGADLTTWHCVRDFLFPWSPLLHITPQLHITSSFARSATSPSFAYVSNPVPDSSLCRAAAPRLCPLQADAPRLHQSASWLLFPIHSASAAARCLLASASAALPRFQQLPDCVRFDCCSLIASASTAAPWLHPLIEVRRSSVSSLVPLHEHPTSVTHTHVKIYTDICHHMILWCYY